ncbi:hypothetical protein RKE30_20420 [Streptomyces sp. Li-HN-5-11]|nr:hypothetical protein [Streptomyces sp. Li-HN-5-11]WNM32611.1 hypothetical protein RKE30_20420 [Streptomyces sp. Li-HN-5-11]
MREKYAYFLEGARTKLAAATAEESPAGEPVADAMADVDNVGQETGQDDVDDIEILSAPQPCVLCGQAASHQVAGFPQRLDPSELRAARHR